MIRGRLLTVCLPLLAILGVAAGALAYWTTQGTGSASATVGKLNAPTKVSVPSTASGTVHVSWTGSTLGDGATPASGYYVTRIKNSDSSTSNACGTSPSSLASSTATSCDDTSVPDGTYHYTVTAVYRSWTATSTASGDVVTRGDLGSLHGGGAGERDGGHGVQCDGHRKRCLQQHCHRLLRHGPLRELRSRVLQGSHRTTRSWRATTARTRSRTASRSRRPVARRSP